MFILVPHFYKEIYKILYPMSVQCLAKRWLGLEGMMVTTPP